MIAAKQNQKFPFHFLSAPPHHPPKKRRKVRKIFGFCSRDRRVRSEYLELRKTLSILYSKCERCTAPVRSGRGARSRECEDILDAANREAQEEVGCSIIEPNYTYGVVAKFDKNIGKDLRTKDEKSMNLLAIWKPLSSVKNKNIF